MYIFTGDGPCLQLGDASYYQRSPLTSSGCVWTTDESWMSLVPKPVSSRISPEEDQA